MHFKTKQEAFETAVAGLMGQGFQRSLKMDGDPNTNKCVFRGAQGRSCAVGYLVSDAELGTLSPANRELPSVVWPQVIIDDCEYPQQRHFIGDLQEAHDTSTHADDMVKKLRAIAEKHGLTFPEGL